MKKKIILIVIICLIIFGVILITTIKPKKEYKLKRNDALAIMVYDETLEDYVPSSTFPTGNYEIDTVRSHCENGSTITGYNSTTGTVTSTMKAADECYLYFRLVHTAAGDISALAGTSGTDGSGNAWGIVNDHGIRYVGQNPSNFVWFNCSDLTNQNENTCERWRIIGVFNEKYDTNNDNIPDTEGDLIKIIRNDSLGTFPWDYKQNGVGSSTSDYGSNDWSDSQLMMMLNPPAFINSGYTSESATTPVHSNTINTNGYVVSGGINIFKNMGSYFNSSLAAYKPASTTTSGWSSTTEAPSTFVRMNPISQPMIATVKWYLTGPNGTKYQSNTNGLASHWYNYERNIDNAGAVFNNSRPKIWYGKIGLMYPSDYGYATSGNSSVSGYDRASCLNKELYNWDSENYQTYCAYNDWLLYVGATGNTTATKGNRIGQWTITPGSSGADNVFYVNSNGRVASYEAYFARGVRPVLSLEASVSISGGTGTYSDPYSLSMN